MRDYEAIKRICQAHANRRAFICNYFPDNGIGAEIGVFYGQFSEIILRMAKPKLLYLVDPWNHDDKFGDRTPKMMNEIYLEVKDKFQNNDNVMIVKDISLNFYAMNQGDGKNQVIDFIYIDGDHSYDGVITDLNGAWKIIKPDGIIAGDDYGENILLWKDSVKRAVNDFCKEKSITPEIIDVPGENEKQFLIRK